jgi:hypothetical protein
MATPRLRKAAPLLASLAAALFAGSARAQSETPTGLAGTWWFGIGGGDAGALLIEFTEPSGGVFAVQDVELTGKPSFGFSRSLAAFFLVNAGQLLSLDSKGQVQGTLELTAPGTDLPIGELVLERGRPTPPFKRLKLLGSIMGEDGLPVLVQLNGGRPPLTFPVLTGRNPTARLSGSGVHSRTFDVSVLTSDLGLPAYDFHGEGPAEIDQVEQPDAFVQGSFVLAPNYRLFGLLEQSSDFGGGDVTGRLRLPQPRVPEETEVPQLNVTAQGSRLVSVAAGLIEPVEPLLSVQPTSFDFGAVTLDAAPLTHTFEVQNIGIGTLSGEAGFVSGSSSDFSLVGPTTYTDLAPGDPAVEIEVAFDPSSAGAKSAQILFSVTAGAGSKVVAVNGIGGVGAISIDPSGDLAFADVAVGQTKDLAFTVTNTGDGSLQGSVTLSGSSEFTLRSGAASAPSISYDLDPQETQQISVRFAPSTSGQKTGTATFTGGGGATRALTGRGI